MSLPPQVEDDPALLTEMMSAARRADAIYQATNYWAFLERSFLPELSRVGLTDFRRRERSVLSSFGATDLIPRSTLRVRAGRASSRASHLLARVMRALPIVEVANGTFPPEEFTPYFYRLVAEKFSRAGLTLAACPTTRVGSPEDVHLIDGGDWSLAHLQICTIFADAVRFIPHPADGVFCELGPGLGRQAEVWARLFPRATILLFDIPPQLYVCHQYLRAVFGTRVVDYRQAVALEPTGDGRLPEGVEGRIVMLPSWRLPAWTRCRIHLFWNSASFQEMEPHVAQNYLQLVLAMNPSWVYLNTIPEGNYWGEWRPGRGGTKLPVTDEVLRRAVEDRCELVAEYDTDYFLRPNDHRSLVYRLRG